MTVIEHLLSALKIEVFLSANAIGHLGEILEISARDLRLTGVLIHL